MQKLDDDKRKDNYITVRGTKADLEAWTKAAKDKGVSLSEWARAWLLWGADH